MESCQSIIRILRSGLYILVILIVSIRGAFQLVGHISQRSTHVDGGCHNTIIAIFKQLQKDTLLIGIRLHLQSIALILFIKPVKLSIVKAVHQLLILDLLFQIPRICLLGLTALLTECILGFRVFFFCRSQCFSLNPDFLVDEFDLFVRLFCSSCCLFVLAAPKAVLVFSSAAFVIVPVKQIGICIFVLGFLQIFQRSLLVHQGVVGFAGLIIVLAHSLEKCVILLLRNFHTTGLPCDLCADILTSFLGNLLIGCNVTLAGFPQRVFLIGRFQQIFVGFQLLGIVLGNLLRQSFSGFLRRAGAARRSGLCGRRTRTTQRFQNILGCCSRSTKHAAQGTNNISSFIRDISLGCIHATKKGRTDATIQCQETVLQPICLAKANAHAC